MEDNMKYTLDNNKIVSMIETINKMKSFCLEGNDKDNLCILSSILMNEAKMKELDSEKTDTHTNQKYTIAPPNELRKVCIDNDLFTCADISQYDRFFEMNESGADFEIMVSYAYACSDMVSYALVRDILQSAKDRYQEISQDSYELDN